MNTSNTLELDDIQAGALRRGPRPTPAPISCCASTTARAGRELLRRLLPVSPPPPTRLTRPSKPGSPLSLTFQGLKALGVPQTSLGDLPAGVPAGHGRPGRGSSATSATARRSTGKRRWARPMSTSCWSRLRPTPTGFEAVVARARAACSDLPGVSAALAAGCPCPAQRERAVRLQGRHQPAGDRGQRHPRHQPARGAAQGGRVRPGLPGRDRRRAPAAAARGARPQRHLRGLPQAAPARGRLPPVPARARRRPGRRGAAGGQDRRPLAQRCAAGACARARRPGARRRPAAQQRLYVSATTRGGSAARSARTSGA